MDNLSKKDRSKCMSRIRSKDTKPELIVIKTLKALKQKYRTHVSRLPGKPDIVLASNRVIIFVNGCFWHQHKGCKRRVMPKVNLQYWKNKLKNNIKRQIDIIKELRHNKWKVLIIWECEVRDVAKLSKKIKLFVK